MATDFHEIRLRRSENTLKSILFFLLLCWPPDAAQATRPAHEVFLNLTGRALSSLEGARDEIQSHFKRAFGHHDDQEHDYEYNQRLHRKRDIHSDDRRLFSLELLDMIHRDGDKGMSKRLMDELDLSSSKIKLASSTAKPESSDNEEKKVSEGTRSFLSQLAGSGSGSGNATTPSDSPILTSIDNRLSDIYEWIRESIMGSGQVNLFDAANELAITQISSINCLGLGLKPDSDSNLRPTMNIYKRLATGRGSMIPLNVALVGEDLTPTSCPSGEYFQRESETVVMIHGFLGGHNNVQGLLNIKDRLQDANRFHQKRHGGGGAKSDASSLHRKQYNLMIVDWYEGANPKLRANYVQSAINSRRIGQMLGDFLLGLRDQCKLDLARVHLLAHSLGTHVAGFAGKHVKSQSGSMLGKITHLDPIGLCFGPLLGSAELRLSPGDARETNALHVARNLFNNPSDGVQVNYMINGGRNQQGCVAEFRNSTYSSIGLVVDPKPEFRPCSHMRVLSLLEDDQSYARHPDECQMVAYECDNYNRFLAGKCSHCDQSNSQCKLMSLMMNPGSARTRTRAINETRVMHIGTGSVSNYCLNYHALRLYFRPQDDAARLATSTGIVNVTSESRGWRRPMGYRLDSVMKVKLNDASGGFFKGFNLDLNHQLLNPIQYLGGQYLEYSLLLNTSYPRPVRIREALVHHQEGHRVVLFRMELSYMSNIDPRIRQKYSSSLCPDRKQELHRWEEISLNEESCQQAPIDEHSMGHPDAPAPPNDNAKLVSSAARHGHLNNKG